MLIAEEKQRLLEEYQTLHILCSNLVAKHGLTHEKLFYKVCTDPALYKDCKMVIRFSLRFLSKTTNECVVETLVS